MKEVSEAKYEALVTLASRHREEYEKILNSKKLEIKKYGGVMR